MVDNAIVRRPARAFVAAAAASALMLGVAACSGGSSSSDSGGGGSSSSSVHFSGIVTSTAAAGNGTIQLNVYNTLLTGAAGQPVAVAASGSFLDRPGSSPVAPHALVTIEGSFFPTGGAQASFTGQLESTTGAFTATGGGYTVTGTRSGSKIQGAITNGAVTSGFNATQDDAGVGKYFCGHWTEMLNGQPTGKTGRFNFVVQGSSVVGAVETDAGIQTFSGTVEANGTVHLHPDSNPSYEMATGTISGTSASGTYNTGDSQGTWSTDNSC